eukprot:TRINITY_DN11254_c0_g2_i2.p1 TRINITY_DN11254_c0_g2~~TRINITY_DN11254_c0_g2_i2.p1  ORF type:complete len:104 (-),score=21.02 TRINITY_DN11254_c0_g2_i2:63-374(-)
MMNFVPRPKILKFNTPVGEIYELEKNTMDEWFDVITELKFEKVKSIYHKFKESQGKRNLDAKIFGFLDQEFKDNMDKDEMDIDNMDQELKLPRPELSLSLIHI